MAWRPWLRQNGKRSRNRIHKMDTHGNHRVSSILGLFAVGVFAGLTARRVLQRRSFSFQGRTVLITGGSRGLGLELARAFAQEGARLALLARDKAELQRARDELVQTGTEVMILPCDLRYREQAADAVRRVEAAWGNIDVLVNNAGVIQVGPLEHATPSDFDEAMALHFHGPLATMLAVLPGMRRAGEGRIVNVSSIGGKVAVPHLAPYSASKFALVGLSDAVRAEVRRHNIFVTTVCPGLMRTGSPAHALFKGRHRNEHAWFSIADSLPLLSINSSRAAQKIVAACRRGQSQLIVGAPAQAAVLASELFPGATAEVMAAVARILPEPTERSNGNARRQGRESGSAWSPSLLTHLSDKAALRNNQ
jgi:short-subunit dehydrogenase